MAKLETVAELLGWTQRKDAHYHVNDRKWWYAPGPRLEGLQKPPAYSTDANASRELLAYTNKACMALSFLVQLRKQVWPELPPSEWESRSDHGMDSFQLLNATPQQIYDAFCATFARELAELEKQS